MHWIQELLHLQWELVLRLSYFINFQPLIILIDCGQPSHAHHTLVESKEQREARGHPVGQDVPYVAMGGITGFSSLADGYLRLDPSGRGWY